MKDESFWELQRTLSAEFSKYVLSHPEIDDRIPDGAQIIFNLRGNPEFNEWARKVALLNKEPKQKMLIVNIEKLLPPFETRLVNPHLELAATL